MLRARNLHEMVADAIRSDRASSYNNVLADRHGDVANVEGSATDVEISHLDENDHLTHTNHYVSERMLPVRRRPRLRRAVRRPVLPGSRPAGGSAVGIRDAGGAPHHPLGPREPTGRGLPASRVGPSDVQDRLLVHGRRDRRPGDVRSWEPLRLDGAGVRVRRITGLPEARTGSDPPSASSPLSVARSMTLRPSSFVAVGSAPEARRSSTLVRSPFIAAAWSGRPSCRLAYVGVRPRFEEDPDDVRLAACSPRNASPCPSSILGRTRRPRRHVR